MDTLEQEILPNTDPLPALKNTSLTGKRAFRLIVCLILVVWLLSRPAFMSSFVSLLDTWGRVTGRSLSTKGSGLYREIMFSIFKKHAVFQSHMHECFQTCDVT